MRVVRGPLVVLLVLVVVVSSGQDDNDDNDEVRDAGTRQGAEDIETHSWGHIGNQTREDRFLSIFTLVQFPNVACSVGSASGTCLTSYDCGRAGGIDLGVCAHNFGVCCYTEVTCGGSSSSNCTHLVSPGYPATYNTAQTCTITFTRTSDVCQLRLDFIYFESFPPDEFDVLSPDMTLAWYSAGKCTEDQFKVEGERQFQYLCGSAPPSWHFNLDVNGKDNPTVFTFLTTAAAFARRFRIKVTMIPCDQRVPSGCGQYFTGNTGTIQSFNYGGFYLAGLDYGICFRKEKKKCTTTLTLQGPSFVACPNDLYRLPVGRAAASTMIPALNTLSLYCQLDTNVAPLLPLAMVQSPLTTLTNGPLIIWHKTDPSDNIPNYRSSASCPTCAGFHQTYSHNDC